MLGEKLFDLRKTKKKTQVDMAKILGIAKTTYASYEQNRRTPDNEMQIKIADYFGITLDELNGRTSPTRDYLSEAKVAMFEDYEGFKDLPVEKQEEIRKNINDHIEFLIHQAKKNKD